ncbi:MAG: SDR family oxidoreductase [Sterolibacterium sp.]|nr:SDR family oxidoreductase [Sterolibacterium sp.]
MAMRRFAGKTALVTGAASGIGLATAERLASEGAQVLACDINAGKLSEEISSLQGAGLAVTGHALDVTDVVACTAAVEAVVAAHGRLDVLCNVAGTLYLKNFTEMTDAEWHQQMAINLHGPFYLSRAAMPHLLASRGNIVNVASIAGMVGVPYGSVYSAAKGGLLMLSKALAVEYGSRGVRVNAICPGSVATPLVEGFSPPEDADFNLLSRLMPLLGEHGQPAGIAATIAFIASEEARFMTGSGVVIDGGQTAI